MEPTQAPPLAAGPVGGPDGSFVMAEWGDPGGVTGPNRPIAGLHVHHEDDESWYVLEGTLTVIVEQEEYELGLRAVRHVAWPEIVGLVVLGLAFVASLAL